MCVCVSVNVRVRVSVSVGVSVSVSVSVSITKPYGASSEKSLPCRLRSMESFQIRLFLYYKARKIEK